MNQHTGGAALNWSHLKSQYPEEKFIHVLPAVDMVFSHDTPMFRLNVAVVDVPCDEKHVYAIDVDYTAKGTQLQKAKTVGLSKVALDMIATASGLSVDVREEQTPSGVRNFVATGGLPGPSAPVLRRASRAWDPELAFAKKRREAEKAWDRMVGKAREYPNNKTEIPRVGWKKVLEVTPEEAEAWVESKLADAWLREREYGPVMTESKAANRVVRALLAMPSKFTPAEIQQKQFLIPRWSFEPDMSNPAIAAAVVGNALQMQSAAWLTGGVQQTPVHDVPLLEQGEPAAVLPAAEAVVDLGATDQVAEDGIPPGAGSASPSDTPAEAVESSAEEPAPVSTDPDVVCTRDTQIDRRDLYAAEAVRHMRGDLTVSAIQASIAGQLMTYKGMGGKRAAEIEKKWNGVNLDSKGAAEGLLVILGTLITFNRG